MPGDGFYYDCDLEDPYDGPEDFGTEPEMHSYEKIVHETEKAILINLSENNTCWFPKSIVSIYEEDKTIFFPSWFTISPVEENEMAHVRVRKEITIELDLSKKEALFLKGLLQNYLGDHKEAPEHEATRNVLWNALSGALTKE